METLEKNDLTYFKFYRINKNSVTTIIENQIYASAPQTFNDPFEGRCKIESQEKLSHYGIKYTPENSKRFRCHRGVVSFSISSEEGITPIDNMLMWSHYADYHRGICVEYSQNIAHLLAKYNNLLCFQKVVYGEYPTIPDNPSGYELEPILHKASCWEYENEYRCVCPKSGSLNLGNSVSESINAIYFGTQFLEDLKFLCHNKDNITDLLKFIRDNNIKSYRMSINPESYKLDKNEIDDINVFLCEIDSILELYKNKGFQH